MGVALLEGRAWQRSEYEWIEIQRYRAKPRVNFIIPPLLHSHGDKAGEMVDRAVTMAGCGGTFPSALVEGRSAAGTPRFRISGRHGSPMAWWTSVASPLWCPDWRQICMECGVPRSPAAWCGGGCFTSLRSWLGGRHAESGSIFRNAMAPFHPAVTPNIRTIVCSRFPLEEPHP